MIDMTVLQALLVKRAPLFKCQGKDLNLYHEMVLIRWCLYISPLSYIW